MPIYKVDARPRRFSYGLSLGILQSNAHIPMPPGDVGNASSYPFPVVYRLVEELTSERLIVQADPTLAEPLIRAAQALEAGGAAAIMGDCGHLVQFQREVAAAVNIPVFLSAWQQVPFIYSILPPHQKIGVLMANSAHYRPNFLKKAGIDEQIPLVVAGMQDRPAFRAAVVDETGVLDSEAARSEVVAVGQELLEAHPEIGAFFLECSDMPPYAAALQQAVGLPVFDFMTLANYVFSALARKPYTGTY